MHRDGAGAARGAAARAASTRRPPAAPAPSASASPVAMPIRRPGERARAGADGDAVQVGERRRPPRPGSPWIERQHVARGAAARVTAALQRRGRHRRPAPPWRGRSPYRGPAPASGESLSESTARSMAIDRRPSPRSSIVTRIVGGGSTPAPASGHSTNTIAASSRYSSRSASSSTVTPRERYRSRCDTTWPSRPGVAVRDREGRRRDRLRHAQGGRGVADERRLARAQVAASGGRCRRARAWPRAPRRSGPCPASSSHRLRHQNSPSCGGASSAPAPRPVRRRGAAGSAAGGAATGAGPPRSAASSGASDGTSATAYGSSTGSRRSLVLADRDGPRVAVAAPAAAARRARASAVPVAAERDHRLGPLLGDLLLEVRPARLDLVRRRRPAGGRTALHERRRRDGRDVDAGRRQHLARLVRQRATDQLGRERRRGGDQQHRGAGRAVARDRPAPRRVRARSAHRPQRGPRAISTARPQ